MNRTTKNRIKTDRLNTTNLIMTALVMISSAWDMVRDVTHSENRLRERYSQSID